MSAHPKDDALMDLVAANAGLQSGLPSPIDDAVRAAHPLPEGRWRKLDEVPYDFIRKRLSVLVSNEDRSLMVTKGASTMCCPSAPLLKCAKTGRPTCRL